MDYPAHLLLFLSCFARLALIKGFDVGAAAAAVVPVVADAVASESAGTGCEFKTTDLSNGYTELKPEPEATPLKTKFDIRINGLREVKGGSFGVDVEYVCSLRIIIKLCLSFNSMQDNDDLGRWQIHCCKCPPRRGVQIESRSL